MLKVGLTGGIASGKSTVAAQFAGLGVPVADADAIAREATAPGSLGLKQLRESLEGSLFDPQGHLDRAALRQRLFADPALRRNVEAVLHPMVLAGLAQQLKSYRAAYCLAVIPLLAEIPAARNLVDRVLVVDCPEEVQLARLMSRDGETAVSARAMLAAQTSRARRLAAGDDILLNEGTRAELKTAIARLHIFYLELAGKSDYRRPGLRLP